MRNQPRRARPARRSGPRIHRSAWNRNSPKFAAGVLRSTPHLAPAKQPPDIRVFSAINYNARRRSKRAGQVTEESSAAESGILSSLTKPLSDVTRKERLYLLGTSAIGITTIMFTGLILLRRASSQRKGQRSAKSSKTTGGGSMFGWGKKDKPK